MIAAPLNTGYKGYLITTDKERMFPADAYEWLSQRAYWHNGLARGVFQNAFDNSFCIAAVKDGRQVAYARLVTDYATYGYLADVYVHEAHRRLGLSVALTAALMGMGWVRELRLIRLRTTDAFGLYARFGFVPPAAPGAIWGRGRLDIPPNQQAPAPFEDAALQGSPGFTITCNKAAMNVAHVHGWVSRLPGLSYGLPLGQFATALQHSFCMGVLAGGELVGFARLVTDYTFAAYLTDVFVAEPFRGRGLATALLRTLLDLDWVRRLSVNADMPRCHPVLRESGFTLCAPEKIMELARPVIANSIHHNQHFIQ